MRLELRRRVGGSDGQKVYNMAALWSDVVRRARGEIDVGKMMTVRWMI